MSDQAKQKYGTHKRISNENIDRIKAIGQMGDSVNNVIGKLLDIYEDVDNCLAGDIPQTKKLMTLKETWSTEAVREHLIMNSYNE